TAGATTINRTTAGAEGAANQQRLVAMYLNGAANFRFQDVTIQTASGTSNGMSSYGVHLTACSDYYFTRTQVIAGNGAAGSNGANGANGSGGFGGGTGQAGDNDDGGNFGTGGAGAGGGGAGAGGGGAGGDTCGENGGNGGDSNNFRAGGGGGGGGAGGCNDNRGGFGGQGGGVNFGANTTTVGGDGDSDGCGGGDPGGNGTNGTGGSNGGNGALGSAFSFTAGFFVPGGIGGNGGDGQGGRGGSGGGGGGGQGGGICQNGAGSGGGGGGGGAQGGARGTGGRGGGGSFAVYLFNNGANARFDDSRLVTGSLGAGGNGGNGGNPGTRGNQGSGSTYTGGEVGAGGNGGFGGTAGSGGDGGDGRNGTTSQLRQDGGTGPVLSDINFNLPGQPTITMENISCTNRNINFTGPSSLPWDFGPNSTPQLTSGNNVNTQWSTIGRKTPIYGSNTYTDFVNILLEDTLRPRIGTTAPLVGGVFRICEGESVDFFEQFPGINYVYNWNLDGGAVPNTYSGTGFASITNITFNTAGTYDIVLNFNTDCCGLSVSDTLELIVDPQPAVVTGGAGAICFNDSTPLTLTASGATTYSWSPSSGLNSTTGTPVQALPGATTTYTVTGLNGPGTCSDQATVTVTINELDINTAVVGANCVAPLTGQATANVTNGSGSYNFNWNPVGVGANPLTNAVAGTYVVVVTDNVTGCVDSASATVPAAPGTPVPVISNITDVICNGDSNGTATVNVSGGSGTYAYNWVTVPGGVPLGGNLPTSSGIPAGDYAVTVFDLLNPGCVATTTVTIPEPLVLNVDTTALDSSFCPGNTGTATVNAGGGTGPYNYNWGFTTGPTASGLATGQYTVTVTDTRGCVDSVIVDIPCVLAVEYAYLTANPYNGAIRLDWETAVELNHDRFDILRSTDGVNFAKIGEVAGTAVEGEGAVYDFIDRDVVPNKIYYYRLEDFDLNGQSSLSNIVQAILPDLDIPEITSIYPNPFARVVNVDLYLEKGAKIDLEISDLLGQNVGKIFSYNLGAGPHTLKLNMNALSQGIYLGKVKVDGIHVNTLKLIKAK
ncbi:MAG: T9SS type A sorting domain-containing protein, partial [Bacteroidota bacterium]